MGNNKELPVNPETGTAATKSWKLAPAPGSTESGFQTPEPKESTWKLAPGPKSRINTASDTVALDWGKYEKYIDQAFIPEGGVDELTKARARNQSTWEQLGNQAVQTTAGVLFGIAENAGYLFDLEAHASTVTGVGNDYSNFLTEFAQRGRQALEDNFSVYRENPEQVFDLGDPAWWIGHGGNLIESIGEFAVTGYGVGKVLGGGAKALAMAFKNSSKGAQIAKGLSTAASTLTAAELAYVEGAMGGQEVYKSTYDKAVEEGLSQEEAINKASQAAATTVQLNTLINTGLNVTAARMFTRPMGGARKLDQAFGKQLGESLTDWKARLAAGSKQPSAIAALGLEAGQESLEEVVNELATALGERKGKELLGLLSEKEEKGGKLATILETLGKDETMLAAILGAMGGIGQTAITSQLPTAKARKEAETKAQQKQLQYVIDRVDSFEAAQAKLSSASKEGDSKAYYQALNDVFATEAFHSIINGTEDQLAGIYQEVANMSEEEAEAAGYDIDPTSIDNYKRRATEAIEDIKKLSKDYEQIINQYNAYDSEAAETGYGENVFKKHLHRHNVERTIDRAQERVNKAKSEHLKNLQRRGTSMDVETAIEIQNDMKAVEQSVANLGQEIQDVISTDARGKAGKRSLETKYGTPPKGTSRKQHAINQIEKRAKRMMKQRDKYASELTKAQQNFITAGNKLEDFNDALNATSQEQAAIISATSTIFENREILKDIDADFKEFSSKTGRDEFVKTRQEEAATQAAETKKEEDSKKAEEKVQEENEKREAAAQPAKEKKAKAKESETQPVDTEVETDPTTDIPVANTEVAPDPEFADEQEINKDIVSEGLATSQETAPSPIMEDGDVQNPSEKKKSKMTEVEPSKSTSDFVIVQAANTFAYLSNQYEEKDGRKETVTSDKAEGLARELESSVEFQPGDTITLEVDRTATWQDKAGQTWSYNDFVNEDGSVDEANVPIAIKKNGRTVAYVRTNDWILQKQEGSDEFANVANSTDPDSAMYNNADLQAKINLALRKDVIKQGSIETTIVNKSVGTLNHNLVDGKRTKGKMSELTPKVKTLAVVKNGQFHVNKDDIYSDRALVNSKKFLENLDENNGLVFAELVTPNGTVLMVPVSIPNLNETQAETIYNALEAKLTNNKSVISQVFGETDFDLSTDSGILNFLRLFTHTTDESEANLKQKVDGDGKDIARYLNYSTKTGAISYARHNRGIVTINTIEELQANKADLLAFLGEKLFSVRLSAINKSDSVSEPVIKADGTVETNHYNNYNDYVKTSLETDVKGNAINENEESYFNQPVIEFSLSFVNSPIQKTGEVAKTTTTVEETIENNAELDQRSDEELLNDIDSLLGFDDSIQYESTPEPVNDSEMSDLQQQFLKDGLAEFLVVDKETNIPYNAYKQSQVVSSIIELTVKAMQTGDTATQAFNKAKAVFAERQRLYKVAENSFDKLTDVQKQKLAITSIQDAQELHDEFEKVNRNWTQFEKYSKETLLKLFGIKETLADVKEESEATDTLDGFEELESHLEKVSFDDGATFQTNHKDTASARLKLFLALQESPTRTFLNLKSFIPFDTVYDELTAMLAGTEPNYDAFIRQLYLRAATKPYAKTLIAKLESSDQQIKNEFVVAFSKQYNKFTTTLWSINTKNDKSVLQLQNIESNRNDVIKRIEAQWVEDQKISPIVKSVNGKLVIDPEVANEIRVQVINLAAAPTIEGAQELLAKMGITMPIEALKYLEENSVRLTGKTFAQNFKTGIFKHMSDAFFRTHDANEQEEVESLLDLNNPLTGIDREGSSIKMLATLASQFSDSIYSNSHRDSEGKTIYSYSLNTALSHKMRELTADNGNNASLNGLSKISFSKYSYWAEQLRTNSKFRENFGVFYLDGLAKRRSNQPGVKRSKQSDREMELQAIAMFQNQGREQAFFIYPTISDKTTTPVISALKHNVKVMFNEDGTYTFGKTTKKLIHDLVRSEIDRIENYKPGKEKIKGYDTGGATKFFLFPGLNEILGDERLPDGRIPVDIQTKLFAAAENHIKELVNSTVKSWEDLGIKTDDNLMFDRTYMNTVLRTETKGANLETMAKYAAIDQEINYILANANVMQLISGDPAQYFKKDVETTMVEYTKRLAKDIAPGLDGNFSKPKYRTVFLKDKETNSQHLEQYKKILGEKSSSYTGMEGTDAQEYTTLEEHLNVMYAYGKISDAEYSRFLEMAREGKDFSGKELDIILQPMKPVYVGNEFDFERDLNKITYIKSSAFPLIPQLTKGLEIDTLRKEMEKHKIDRAAYVTAAKLGSTKAVDIWDGDAMVDTFTLEGKAVTLDRSGFRIQQEVPYKEDKVKILTVSQMNKLLFEGILAIEGMPELKARKEEIRKELFKKGKEKLLKSIGAKEVNGEYIFEDLSKIQDVLIKEARDRGYPINDIQALELTEDKKAFRIPIGFNASSKKFESVLMSLITNNILKQKIAGKSYVQASSAGILTGANKSKKWSELTSKELGGIIFVGDVNLDTGLKFVRKEDGKVRGAQLLVPFYFRSSEGKPLNIKDYTKEVGGKLMIDPDKMDSELLKLVGARIPNQGHSSMLPIEIVGFLPESMGDLIIVPDEITKQMGADFDVDKLYTYQYEYTIGEDGKLTKEDSLKNEYVDIHWKVLTHPEVLPRVLAPLDQKGEYSVAGEAAKINEIRSKNAKKESFLYRRNQQRSFMQNRGGKSGVGIFSLASTFNATIQDQNLYLGVNTPKGPVPVTISVFKGFDLTKLSGKGTNPIADKAAVISDMQSAAVDNAKEQTLDKLNLNDYTFKVANAMAQLEDKNGKNLTIQHISRLLSQQIILDYVKEVEKLSDSTIDNFIINKEEEAMRIVKEKYEKNATTIIGNFTLDLDNMLTMIENEAAPNGEWYSQQLLVLEAFAKFYEVGSTMSNIQSAINSDSKGVDPSFFQVTEKLNRINEIGKNPIIRGAEPLLSSTTEVGTATEMGPKLAKALMSKFLPQGSNAMNEVFNQISRATGRSKMNADMKQRIFDSFKAYVFTSNGLFAEDASAARAELMIDNETPSLATRVKEAQQTWGKHNFLLRRLMAKFSDVKGDPSTVEYVASTGERLDEQESLKAFIDMLASTNSEQSKLAEDLVRYSYLTSGTQHANNFMKFIPNIYLKAIEADQKLRDFDWGTTRHAYDFTTQFVQNNPDFAIRTNWITILSTEQKYDINDAFTLPKIDENLPKAFLEFVYSVTEPDGSVTLTYPSFFQTRQKNEYELYVKVGEDSDGDGSHLYQRIDTLGGKGGIVEYNAQKRIESSMYSKNKTNARQVGIKNVPSTKVSSSTDNPNAYTEPLKKYGLKSSMPSNEFMESVKKISSISDNPGHRLLADILYGIKANLKPFTFNVDNKLPIKGRFRNDLSNDGEGTRRTISINPSMFETNGSFSSNDLEATILHELIHGYTSQILKAYDSGLTLPANVTKACKSLNAVREKLFKSLSEQEKADAEAFDKLSPEEKRDSKLPRSLKAKYYALYNNVEFITMTLTDVEFQKFLNEIPFEGSKTLLDRLIEVVSNLYKAIANAAGIEVKQDSALEAAINESINLLANVSPISAEFNQVNDSISLSTQYDPVNPRLLDQIRSEFGLRNEKGSAGRFLHTDKGYAKAVARALELNTKNKKFMEKYGDKYKAFVTKAFGEKGDTRVYYVISFTEITSDDYSIDFGEDTTISPSIKKIVSRLQSRIRELNRSMSESKSNKVAYQEKIDALEKQIERLEEENSLKEISAVAKTHLDWASNILDHKKITASELKEVEQIINVWRDVKSLFKDDYQSGGKYQEVLSQISNRAEDLEIKYLDMAKAVMIEEINATSTRQVKMKDLELMADITSTRANMLDLSHVDNPVAQALDTWLKNSARDTNTEFTMVAKDIKTEFDKLKEHPEFKKNGFDIFLQKDKNGKWTGGLVNRYSQDWYDARAKSWAKVRRDKGNTKKWADHFKWLRENEVMVDTGVLFEQDGSHKSDGTYKKHVKELINEFGETRANEMIQQAQDKYMDYLQDLDAFILSTEAEMEVDSEITQEMSDAKIQRWKLENSPKAYISNYKGGLIVQGLKMRGYKYTVSKPRKTVNGKKTKWYDSSYEKIENDPVLNQFYNFYRSAMAKNMSVLPTYALKDTQANFIPFVKKQLIEQFTTSGLKGSMVGLWENFADSISSIESSTVSADRNMRTGNVNKRIPIKFLQEGDITDKSTNLIKALEMFTLMSLNYKHKSKVEDKALILQRLINEASQKQVTANNEVQRDTEGNLYETKDGNVNLKKLVQHTIDYTLYNKRRNEGDATGIFIADSPKNSIKATKLAKQIKDLNRKLSLGTITNEEHSKQVEPLQKELDELGGKNVSTADIADFTMKITQLKGMALNIFSASNNMTFGLVSNIIHASGGEDFTMKEALQAYRIMLNSTSKSLFLNRAGIGEKTAKKLNALVEKFDVLFEVNEAAYRGNNKDKSGISKLSPYELQKRGEYFVQGMNMVARMLNEKVTTKDGKETSLFEAFDENGNWRTDVYGENSGWNGDISDDNQMKDFRKFRNRLTQINKRIHGNYDPASFPMMKKSVLGRFAMQFRSWLAESVASRFDHEQWDEQLGRNTKGTYRTIGQLGPMQTIKAFAKIAIGKGNGISDISAVDQANLRKAFTELAFIIGLNIMALSVMALSDDDDEDKMVRNIAINQLYRVQADLTFYMTPSSFDRILSNPVPAIRTYLDAERAMAGTIQYIMQDEELDGRKKLESEDVWLKILKAFPLVNQLPKATTQAEKVFK